MKTKFIISIIAFLLLSHNSWSQCASVPLLNIDHIIATTSCKANGTADYTIQLDVTVLNQGNTSACFDYYVSGVLTRICWGKGTTETDLILNISADCGSTFELAGWSSPSGGGSQCGPGSGAALPINFTNPLPVELISFKGAWERENVLLKWTTASEENFSHFEIQKLNHSETKWETISNVRGAEENTLIEQSYVYLDHNPNHKNYYRLKMIDNDGTYEYSKIVTINSIQDNQGVSISPNPSFGVINFNITSKSSSIKNGLLKVVDINGKIIESMIIELDNNESFSFEMDLSELPAGVYFYSLVSSEGVDSGKIRIVD